MSTEECSESPEFRQHIRTLLYDYYKTHLTTDYVTFTEDLVLELLEDIKPIPLTDPYSFVVPVEPFQTFSQIHSLSMLQPYDEILPTTKEAVACIKTLTSSKTGPSKSSRLEWTQSTYEPLPEPFFPALTRRSRKQTPALGKKSDQAHHGDCGALTTTHGFGTIPVESIPEAMLDTDDILQVKFQVKSEEMPEVKAVLKSTADMMRKQPSYQNRYLDPSFLCRIDYIKFEKTEEEFTPIFPRNRAYPGSSNAQSVEPAGKLKIFADILPVINTDVSVEDLDGPLYLQHLKVVDGWQTIQSSPPSTPSSKVTDEEDQRDQLLLESSPNTEPPLVEEILKSKMDVLIPRQRQIGGKSGIVPHIFSGKTLQTFLHPLLSQAKSEPPPNPEGNEERPFFHPSPPPSSLVGQAESMLELNNVKGTLESTNQKCELDLELEKFYGGHGLDDMIMSETLDDKHDMLMEIPNLPEPNVHPPSDFYVPKSFADFLVPATEKNTAATNTALIKSLPCHQFLKKVKGKQSLQLSLSWVTFTVDKPLPSVNELMGVDELFEPNDLNGDDYQQASELVKSLEFAQTVIGEDKHLHSWTQGTLYLPAEPHVGFQVLLNRQERKRLAKMEGCCQEDVKCSEDEDEEMSNRDVVMPTKESQHMDAVKRHETNVNIHEEEYRVSSWHKTSSIVSETLERLIPLQGENAWREDIRNNDRIDDGRPTKRPRLDLSDNPSYNLEPEINPSSPGSPRNQLHVYGDSGYHSSADFYEDDKENYPPLSSSWPREDEPYHKDVWNDDIAYHPTLGRRDEQYAEEHFEHLSVDSRSTPSGSAQRVNALEHVNADLALGSIGRENLWETERIKFDSNHSTPLRTLDLDFQIPLAFEPEIASHSLGISAFAALRARKISEPKIAQPIAPPLAPILPTEIEECDGVPHDLIDQNTLVVTGSNSDTQSIHRYMASLDFIQKHGLVRALRSEECGVELVERQTLGGVDLIIDPYCAVVFLSLFTLPARCETYVKRISEQSWKFSRILIVLEAYPDSHTTRVKPRGSPSSKLNAYTPPILKSIKKLRRDINIADACGTKRTETHIQYAFADSVQDAALVTRMFGSRAEERDETFGAIWGDRSWLSVEFIEEEERLLAGVTGMNHFSASIILSQASLEAFVDFLPEERLELYSGFISQNLLNECSADLGRRFQAMNTSSDGF